MENKINIAELLRDYPKGMELDCTMYDNVTFNRLQGDEYIIINRGYNNGEVHLTKFGQMFNTDDAKCVIFPKGKTTWEGFRRPFVDGDIVYFVTEHGNEYITIYKNDSNVYLETYIDLAVITSRWSLDSSFYIDNIKKQRLASEEEKEKLFKAIRDNGYKWNAEIKTLEKLVKPNFKDGDILAIGDTVYIYNGKEELSPFPTHYAYVIADKNGLFAINTLTKRYGTRFATEEEKNILFEAIKDNGYRWSAETKTLEKLIELKKFDITTLKPFDQVLVRDDNECVWKADFYSHYKGDIDFCYVCAGDAYTQCIPYNEENAHLVGTNHDCSDKYKTWKNE